MPLQYTQRIQNNNERYHFPCGIIEQNMKHIDEYWCLVDTEKSKKNEWNGCHLMYFVQFLNKIAKSSKIRRIKVHRLQSINAHLMKFLNDSIPFFCIICDRFFQILLYYPINQNNDNQHTIPHLFNSLVSFYHPKEGATVIIHFALFVCFHLSNRNFSIPLLFIYRFQLSNDILSTKRTAASSSYSRFRSIWIDTYKSSIRKSVRLGELKCDKTCLVRGSRKLV